MLRFIAVGECRASSECPEPLRNPQLAPSVSTLTERGEEDKAASGGADLWDMECGGRGEVQGDVDPDPKHLLMITILLDTNTDM